MTLDRIEIDRRLYELERAYVSVSISDGNAAAREAGVRWVSDCNALRFHLTADIEKPAIVALLGGTGAGKSTLVNRLVGETVVTESFRRTYTHGVVAASGAADRLSGDWLGLPHRTVTSEGIPARGEAGSLTVVHCPSEFLDRNLVLIDTPDLDGDRVEHHAEADRAFRWATAVLFLVTPEKYQMTELPPYYRLASRYGLPAFFAMNKCENREVIEDYEKQLVEGGRDDPKVFAIPRDDSAFVPDPPQRLEDLKEELVGLAEESSRNDSTEPTDSNGEEESGKEEGTLRRARDVIGRFRDSILSPLQNDRNEADALIEAFSAMVERAPDLDIGPLTLELKNRMREKSVLYLMGPGRVVDRAKRLFSRVASGGWKGGEKSSAPPLEPESTGEGPDFRRMLIDQFVTAQSRMDDLARSGPGGRAWIEGDSEGYEAIKIDPEQAGNIAEKEIDSLTDWLKNRWDATPRDTKVLEKLLKHIPGGSKIGQWTEAAPYLLLVVCAGSNVFLGPLDLLVIGGVSLGAWLGEKLSNEVTARVREANRNLCSEYSALAREQVDRYQRWIDERAPGMDAIESLEEALDAAAKTVE